MKTCTRCKKDFELDKFPIVNSKTNKRSSLHDECKREYDREHYEKHKERRRDKKNENGRKSHTKKRNFIINILKKSCCMKCGNSDWRVLEFDHRDRNTKSFNIADGVNKALKDLIYEINKCDILCSNCHVIKTIEQRGYYKF